ncbi:MAG: alpha/beta hydrolase [Eubacteriaceae bacterium]|nr:alpha/beta hydrolase [Eubacteriaceae bacterium]
MYDKFVLRNLEEGIIRGYSWHLEDPEKVICIVHGIGEYGGRFDRVAEVFREKNMAACALDLRGHGESLGKRGDCAPRNSVLDDVSELLRYAEEKYPGKPIILYGHSMGGNIVLDYRARGEMNDHPAGYIISAPWVRLVRPVPPLLYKVVKLLSRIAPSFTIGSDINEANLGNPEKVKPFKDNPMVHNRISALCAVDGFDKGIGFEDGTAEDDRRAAKIPTLLMHGSEDRICDVNGSRRIAKRLQAQGDDLEYIEWEGLFHEIHNGNETSTGDEVIAKMVRWAQEL